VGQVLLIGPTRHPPYSRALSRNELRPIRLLAGLQRGPRNLRRRSAGGLRFRSAAGRGGRVKKGDRRPSEVSPSQGIGISIFAGSGRTGGEVKSRPSFSPSAKSTKARTAELFDTVFGERLIAVRPIRPHNDAARMTNHESHGMLTQNRLNADLDWVNDLRLDGFQPAYSTPSGALFQMDAIKLLSALPTNSVDLVLTSPPFALTRKKEYGNEPLERYIAWFMSFTAEIKRILKPTGSFVLDIGGAWKPGAPVRSVYHFELAVKLARDFHLAQEFYWYNPSRLPTPAEWVTVRRLRVKDAVNMVWWFSKTEWPKADNRRVLQPYSESMKGLIKHGYKAMKRPSGHDISTKFQRDNGGAIPPNLITIANTESNSAYLRACRDRGIRPHPARYPEQLAKFFIDF
jgi:DNA modification methylase